MKTKKDLRVEIGTELILEIAPCLDQVMASQGIESVDDQCVVFGAVFAALSGYVLARAGQEKLQMILAAVSKSTHGISKHTMSVVKP